MIRPARSSYTELGIEAIAGDRSGEESNNESALLSLFDDDTDGGFGDFLSKPYDASGPDDPTAPCGGRPFSTGDEFLPSQLLSDLLAGSAEPARVNVSNGDVWDGWRSVIIVFACLQKPSSSSSNWSDIFADLDPLNDPGSVSRREPLDLL